MNKIILKDIGADPEFILQDKRSGKYISSVGIIPGTKYEPFELERIGHQISTDNVLVEIGVMPTNDPKEMYNSIEYCLSEIHKLTDNKFNIRRLPYVVYDDDQLQTEESQMIGCEGDLNCWTEIDNEPVTEFKNGGRSAGAHIHLAYKNPNFRTSLQIIRALDLFISVPMVLLDTSDGALERKKLYGKAGAFRICPYGCEYRSPSPRWTESLESITWMFSQVRTAIQFLNDGNEFSLAKDSDIPNCINMGDRSLAKSLVKKYNINLEIDENVAIFA